MSEAAASGAAPLARPGSRRWRMLAGLAVLVALAIGGYAAWHERIGRHYERTDNAYVQGPVVQITPQMPGTIIEIVAQDTEFVAAGQLLVRLDPADATVALTQAKALLAQTVREVSALYGNNETLAAQIRAREAELAQSRSTVRRLQGDLVRRGKLARSGAVSAEELTHLRAQLEVAASAATAAQAGVAAAREQLLTSRLLTNHTTPAEHPSVERAAAAVREAMLALERTEIRAPTDGHVAQRRAQLGQRVAAGAALMSVIPLNRVWVDANFKEGQLANMRLDQAVELTADTYGREVVYHGRIEGLGAGTGAAFALLPAQNATGNWIKVVQRVPVRIRLDETQLREYPLRIGLSMQATVRTDDTSGQRLALAPSQSTGERLGDPGRAAAAAQVEATVQEIITRNLGAPSAGPTRSINSLSVIDEAVR